MPILPPLNETDEVLRDEAFDDATKRLVCDAVNGAWLFMVVGAEPAANIKRYPEAPALLARRIINAARHGTRDLDTLKWDGILYVRQRLTPDFPKG